MDFYRKGKDDEAKQNGVHGQSENVGGDQGGGAGVGAVKLVDVGGRKVDVEDRRVDQWSSERHDSV